MTVNELIEELKTKPPTYKVDLANMGESYEAETDHENQRVIIW